MNHQHLEELLHELAATPVADPDPLTERRIEARWRTAAEQPMPRSGRGHGARRSVRRRPATVGAVALVAAAACTALVIGLRPGSGSDLVVAEAAGITVMLPSGEIITPFDGATLPDGAIIESAPGSAARIGGEVLTPGTRYVVVDGRLRIANGEDPATPPTVSPSPTPTTQPPTRPGTYRPNGVGTPGVDVTAAPTTSSPPSASKPITTKPAPPARLGVQVATAGKQARIVWSPVSDSRVKKYVVVRVKSWNGTTLPKGKRIATVSSGRPTTATDKAPQNGTFYVVAALGDKNRVIAIGSVAAPNVEARRQATSTTSTTATP